MAAGTHRETGQGCRGPVDLGEGRLGNFTGGTVRTPETMRRTLHWFRASLLVVLASLATAQKPAVETAWQLIAQGKQAQAVTLLRDLIRTEPRNADARLLLGSILME